MDVGTRSRRSDSAANVSAPTAAEWMHPVGLEPNTLLSVLYDNLHLPDVLCKAEVWTSLFYSLEQLCW